MSPRSKAIVFDLDDTLYLERDFVASATRALEERLAPVVGRVAARRALSAAFPGGLSTGRNIDGLVAVLEHEGRSPGTSVEELLRLYRHHSPAITLCADVRPTLARLRAGGYQLGVLTDGAPSIQRGKLAALGIADAFDAIVVTDELGPGRAKPHPAPFGSMERSLGCEGRAACYVGDNPEKDVAGARSRGWMTVRIRRPGSLRRNLDALPGNEPDVEIESLTELVERLEPPPRQDR